MTFDDFIATFDYDFSSEEKTMLKERVTFDQDIEGEYDNPSHWIDMGGLLDELRSRPKMTAHIERWGLEVTSPDIDDIDAQEHYTNITDAATESSSRSTNDDKTFSMSWSFG